MTQKIVCLFPDTNLFIHGKALNEIDWQEFAAFDEVHLIICRPTQKEIDKHKNRGGERLARRARTASSLLRDVINNGPGIVRQANPCVKVMLMVDLRPAPTHADRLNYEEPDDQLVGIVHAFRQGNPGADARVLTHDTGPMASARMVGVPVFPIPDVWLRPPEASEEEKKVRELEAKIARLTKSEPNFLIAFVDDEGNNLDAIEYEAVRYEALTKEELDGLMDRIRARLPVATDFGAREPVERFTPFGNLNIGTKQILTPATDEQIAAYRDQQYPQWLKECERILRGYHDLIRQQSAPLMFCIVAVNDGTRPAKDALITIEARGHFKIRPPAYKNEDDDEHAESGRRKGPLRFRDHRRHRAAPGNRPMSPPIR